MVYARRPEQFIIAVGKNNFFTRVGFFLTLLAHPLIIPEVLKNFNGGVE